MSKINVENIYLLSLTAIEQAVEEQRQLFAARASAADCAEEYDAAITALRDEMQRLEAAKLEAHEEYASGLKQ